MGEGEWLDKETTIHRDKEKLLPSEIVVEFIDKKPKIKFIPITRGEFKNIFGKAKDGATTRDTDEMIISEYIVTPNYSKEDLEFMSYKDIISLSIAVISGSTGQDQKTLRDSTYKRFELIDEEILKKKV